MSFLEKIPGVSMPVLSPSKRPLFLAKKDVENRAHGCLIRNPVPEDEFEKRMDRRFQRCRQPALVVGVTQGLRKRPAAQVQGRRLGKG